MQLVLLSILIGQMTVTSYRSVPQQTDNSPFYTATGEHVHKYGIAVSQDLLKKNGGPVDYGDWVYIEGYGMRVVNDCTNARLRQHVDMWVATYEEEKAVGVRTGRLWLVKTVTKGDFK